MMSLQQSTSSILGAIILLAIQYTTIVNAQTTNEPSISQAPTILSQSPSTHPTHSTIPSSSPTNSYKPSTTSLPSLSSAPSDRMQFDTTTNATELVNNLISTTGEIAVEISNVQASSHIESCAALFRRGHTLGTLYQKGPAPNYDLLKDANGNYIPTNPEVYMVPDEGLILSSGSPQHLNTNDEDDQTTIHSKGGDIDLKKTVDDSNGINNSVFDACVLQFDFRCNSPWEGGSYVPRIEFNYIFGSEEYYEYVFSEFNDVFGFYLNGNNIAKLPTTNTGSDVVSINNVNYHSNKQYFHGNDPGTGWQQDPTEDPNGNPVITEVVYPTIEMDGFTDTLTAIGIPKSDVNEWNTIKLAVGDVGDNILDSWVILESASFTCVDVTQSPSVSLAPSIANSLKPSVSSAPSESSQPSTSTQPTASSKPTTSSAPTTSSNPTISSLPTLSITPTTSSKPTVSSAPSISTNPTLSTMPTISGAPTVSAAPSISSAPSESTAPSLSSQPSMSGAPSESSKPSSSSQPSTSIAPTLSTAPTSSTAPSTSSAPSQSSAPSTSSKPTISSMPTISGAPTVSSAPTISGAPTLSSEPSISSAPSQSSAPTTSSQPSISSQPSTSSIPTPEATLPATLGPNVVFDDQNGDGLQDGVNETGIANVTVDLYCYNENETAIVEQSTTTDEDGMYIFYNVYPALCYIQVIPPTVINPSNNNTETYVFSPIVTGGNQIDTNGTSPMVDLDWNDNVAAWDVGMYLPVTLGNKVWEDMNANGIQDEVDGVMEPGIAGLPVTLLNANDEPVAMMLSEADGSYWFTNLPPGDYAVRVDLPPDFVFSRAPWDCLVNSTEPAELMINGTCYNTSAMDYMIADMEIQPGLLIDPPSLPSTTTTSTTTPFPPVGSSQQAPEEAATCNSNDECVVNGDGNKNICNSNGVCGYCEIGTTRIDTERPLCLDQGNGIAVWGCEDSSCASGTCGSPSCVAGIPNYCHADHDTDYGCSMPTGGRVRALNHQDDPNPMTGTTPHQNLTSGENNTSFDAGIFIPVTVAGLSFIDSNGNGLLDVGEPPLGGVIVTVFPTDSRGAPDPNGTAQVLVSDSNGEYSINLPPGTYTATITPPGADHLLSPLPDPTPTDLIGNDFDPLTNSTDPVQLLSGADGTGSFDAGFYIPVSIYNEVFDDDNGNGIREPMEGNYPANMNISLYDPTSDTPDEPIVTVQTGEDGSFIFPDVPPGDYEIEFEIPEDDDGVVFSPQDVGGDDCSDSDVDPITGRVSVTVVSGQDVTCVSAGIARLPMIGPNTIFEDDDGDGIQDGDEEGLPNVLVVLSHPNGTVAAFNTTNDDGEYEFPDLQPGDYYLSVNNDPDYEWSPVVPGGNQISDDPSTLPYGNRSPIVSLGLGDTDTTLNGGMYLPMTIQGAAFHDLDADGIEDQGEEGLEGMVATLYDDNDNVVDNMTTDPTGTWSFDSVLPGTTYYVKITPPIDPSGNDWQLSPSSDFDPTTFESDPILFESGSTSQFNAGLFLPATIDASVLYDNVTNGIEDGDEEPFDEPVTVKLYDDDGDLVAETQSNEDGEYGFTEITPGSYSLEFLLPQLANDTSFESINGRTGVTVVTGGSDQGDDTGVNNYGLYYPDWINEVQVCTNDGFDAEWLKAKGDIYLYESKEECCENHFWWRMDNCMSNEEFYFFSNGEFCNTEIYFEQWEHNSPHEAWTEHSHFKTLEECCATTFAHDYDGCMARSPLMFQFEFCFDAQGLVNPLDCQSADIYANVIEDAINGVTHNAYQVVGNPSAMTPTDANITMLGDVSLNKGSGGGTICGGSLAGQGYTNQFTGTYPDVSAASGTQSNVCGIMTVEDSQCRTEQCLRDHYNNIVTQLAQYVNSGDLTESIRARALLRLPPVTELRGVTALGYSLTTQNLVLPATMGGSSP